MSVCTRSWYGLLAIAMLAGTLGLLIRNAGSQEEGHEHAKPIVVSEEASDENPFKARKAPEREERERPEVKERERGERPTERDILKQQVEVFKIALHALQEAKKADAADVLQRAIRAREVTLEERRDDEAHMIRERAPNRGQLAEILSLAAGLWREFKNEEKAAVVGRVAEEFARQPGERDAQRKRAEQGARERAERPTEREVAGRHLEVMRLALPALREGERGDAAELLERAIRAFEVMLEGRRDDEAQQIRSRMPNRGQLAEILTMASNLWREFNNQEKAEVVGRLAKELAGKGEREQERERPDRERREVAERERPRAEGRPPELARRHQELEEQARAIKRELEGLRDDQDEEARELQAKLREITAHMQEMQRERRRPEGERDNLRGRLHELEEAFVRAQKAGKEDEAARLKRQMQELAQHLERPPVRRPAAKPAPRTPEEVERLKGSVRELSGQMNELRREMAEMRRLLEALVEKKREEQ